MKSEKLICMRDLRKHYQLGTVQTKVLHGINLDINRGEFVAIMGASGAGKSTFMNILGLLDTLSSGSYKLDGVRIEKYSEDELAGIRNKKIGFVFQMFNLLPRLTALENVVLPLMYSQVQESEQIKRGQEVLHQVGLSHRINHRPNEMSGGEQQRVAVARALINNPSLILADEPTGNLDTKTSYELMNIFCDLHYNKGYTVVMITHEPDIAEYSERVIFLRDGQVEKDKQRKSCAIQRLSLKSGAKQLMRNGKAH